MYISPALQPPTQILGKDIVFTSYASFIYTNCSN